MKVDFYRTISTIVESDVSSSAKAVMVCLLNYRNSKTGLCFPSMTTIADGSGLQPTAAKKAISDLKDSGLIEWESKVPKRGNAKVNHYTLLFIWAYSDHMDDHMDDHMNDHIGDRSGDRSGNQSGDRSEYDHKPIGTNRNQKEPKELIPPSGDKPEKPKAPRKVFKPPTVEEVAAYCQERKNTVDPATLVDHYTAANWFRGKTKIKDWKACVRTWEKNSYGQRQPGGGRSPQRSQTQTFDDIMNEDLKERIGEYQNGSKQERGGDGYEIFLSQGPEGKTEY